MAELLRVDNLSKSFAARGGLPWRRRRVAAVNDVSLSVQRGRTLGLVGESGSGKSTLGRCILGLAKPDSGQISFDGVEVQALSGRALSDFRRRVQPVFQDPYGSLDPRWPVGRSVRESLDCYRIGTSARPQPPRARPVRAGRPQPCAWPAGCRPIFPAASASAWASPRRSPASPSSSSPTNRSARST